MLAWKDAVVVRNTTTVLWYNCKQIPLLDSTPSVTWPLVPAASDGLLVMEGDPRGDYNKIHRDHVNIQLISIFILLDLNSFLATSKSPCTSIYCYCCPSRSFSHLSLKGKLLCLMPFFKDTPVSAKDNSPNMVTEHVSEVDTFNDQIKMCFPCAFLSV